MGSCDDGDGCMDELGTSRVRTGRCRPDGAAPARRHVHRPAVSRADGGAGAGHGPPRRGDAAGPRRHGRRRRRQHGAGRSAVAEAAAELGCDAVVGHSLGANVALEMAASGAYACPLILLAPSFSRADEARALRVLDGLGRVMGHWPYSAMLRMVDAAVKDSPLPEDRRAELVADLRRNDPRVIRRGIHAYLGYLDRYRTVAPRLCAAGVRPGWCTASPATGVSPPRSGGRSMRARTSRSSRSRGRAGSRRTRSRRSSPISSSRLSARLPDRRDPTPAPPREDVPIAGISKARRCGWPSCWPRCRSGSISASASRWSTCCASAASRCGSASSSGSTRPSARPSTTPRCWSTWAATPTPTSRPTGSATTSP